ncbi:cytochrome c-type biogenesis protein [Umboniibacter marinipuniceus]|uniref:Cytochrome c-type biogenesis protein n=1 Tax=Umboniibacter marinipuniceus TaxID=569599 RepID=A0A3M0A880_9GAMM|nr:cytochrome c-type biogenesis protein [Umboniibacter marinipuniceus]RMA81293.1 cytochrome c-type biogenesis protein CcmH [Umboniibacter marinipuniceus]
MKKLFAVISFLLASSVYGSIDLYEFRSELDRIRFESLTAELRCPKCQNQAISDSDAPIAQDMKDIVYEMLMADKSDIEIKDYLVARYGEFVLYSPEMTGVNYVLWLGPFVLLFLVVTIAIVVVRRNGVEVSDSEESYK